MISKPILTIFHWSLFQSLSLGAVIFMSKLRQEVDEFAGVANVALYRKGDTSKEDHIWCVTQSGNWSLRKIINHVTINKIDPYDRVQ